MQAEFQLYVFGDYSLRNNYREAFRRSGKTYAEINLETRVDAEKVLSEIKMLDKAEKVSANFPILMKGSAVVVHGDVLESSLRQLLNLYGGAV